MTRIFHDPMLVGNGEWCPSCCPQGPPPDLDRYRFRPGCNLCGGRGRIPFSAAEVVARTISDALAAPPRLNRKSKIEMRRPTRPAPRPPAQAPDDFDRMGWEVCKFGNGGARRHATHAGQATCDCQNRGVACCDSVRPTVEAILNILVAGRR